MNQRSGLTQSFTTLSVYDSTRRKARGHLTSVWCKSLPSTITVLRKDLEMISVKEGPSLKSVS